MSFRIYWLKKNIIVSIIFFLIYTLNRIFKSYISFPIISYICQNHLNDFIGGLLFCSYVNILLLLNHKKPLIKLIQLYLLMVPVAISWEYIFPLFLSYSTSDIIDVIMYLLGTLLYYLLLCKNTKFKENF